MTGEHEKSEKLCPLCGGKLVYKRAATVPFVLDDTVAVIKNVPAEVCANCREAYVTGAVTDRLVDLLARLQAVPTEVSIISYSALPVAI